MMVAGAVVDGELGVEPPPAAHEQDARDRRERELVESHYGPLTVPADRGSVQSECRGLRRQRLGNPEVLDESGR